MKVRKLTRAMAKSDAKALTRILFPKGKLDIGLVFDLIAAHAELVARVDNLVEHA